MCVAIEDIISMVKIIERIFINFRRKKNILLGGKKNIFFQRLI